MKIHKKIIAWSVYFAVIAISFFMCKTPTSASGGTTLNCWYSDSTSIGHWNTAPSTYVTNLDSSFTIVPSVNTAITQWNNAGITSSRTMTKPNAKILFYSGTKSDLRLYGFYYSTGTLGQTVWDNYSLEQTIYYKYQDRNIYGLSKVSASVCKEAGTGYYSRTAVHEYGHALGWNGHANSSSDIMYPYTNVAMTTSLSQKDKNHLAQMY